MKCLEGLDRVSVQGFGLTLERDVMRIALWIMISTVVAGGASGAPAGGFDTVFELSGGLETPRYEQTRTTSMRLAELSDQITYTTFGTSPQGRDLMMLIVDRDGAATPPAVRKSNRAVLMIQACIHAGESDGKDAGLMLLRDLATGKLAPSLLDHVTILFLPIFNVDGHEHFGPLNRPNQSGPEQMGFRVTANNLNLNRDFVKADAPEMQAWLDLYSAWMPDFLIDSHVSDGADFQYTLMYDMPMRGNMEAALSLWSRDVYLDQLQSSLTAKDLPLMPYGGFRRWHDPRSGINVWISGPRYTHGYTAVRNRPGLLLESHVLKDYASRVEGTYQVFLETLRILNREHATLRRLNADADQATASPAFRTRPYPLTFRRSVTDSVMIDFLGFDYDMVESSVTGGSYPVFHRDQPQTMRIPLFGTFEPATTIRVPEIYFIPPQWSNVIELLEHHGVALDRLTTPRQVTVESVRFEDVNWAEHPYEGRHQLSYQTRPVSVERTFPTGTAVVDMAQPAARLILHALSPEGPDALVRWGFFDPIFERKEYIESYILEPMLPGMLADDPQLAADWEAAKQENPELLENHWSALLWFYERSPWWDERIGLYPVGWTFGRSVIE